jgi:next-to-BRCA1 protein 1
MGDRNIGSYLQSPPLAPKPAANAPSEVKTVAEFKPEIKQEEKQTTQPIPVVESLPKSDLSSGLKLNTPATLLSAAFVSDSIPDGMAVVPGARFTQIWTLKNDGAYPWPAGCSVRYVGGDNMLNVDNGHPASVADINEATESNVVGREVQVGESSAFKVTLKAPLREGKAISYWRVKAPDGTPFGHRLWCDIQVKTPEPQSSMPPKLSLYNGSLAQAQQQQQFQQKLMQQHQQQQAQFAQDQQRQSMQSYLASQQRLQLINQQREAAMQREMARHGYQGHSANNNANFSHPTMQFSPAQAISTSPIADSTVRKENANKEIAKLRVEQIKAKIMKQRADKYKSDAKAARAAAEKKSAEEDAKVKKIIEAVTKTEDEETEDLATSQMVFPKLEKESPASSIIQSSSSSSKGKAAYVEDEETENTTTVIPVETAPSVSSPGTVALGDDFEDFDDLEVLSADEVESNDGFLTDEEYDILDASDQETVTSK